MIVKHTLCVVNKTVTLNCDAVTAQTSVTMLSSSSLLRFSKKVRESSFQDVTFENRYRVILQKQIIFAKTPTMFNSFCSFITLFPDD